VDEQPPPPNEFAALTRPAFANLLAAAWRAPRPSLLDDALALRGAKEREGGEALGLRTVGDLLAHVPRRHVDRGEPRPVAELMIGGDATVEVEVRSITTRRGRPGRGVTRTVAVVADRSGQLEVVWFNQPWVERKLPVGTSVVLHGRFEGKGRFRVLDYQLGGDGGAGGTVGLVPVHPASEGLPPKRIRKLVGERRLLATEIVDPLPTRLRLASGFPDRPAAIDAIHFPESEPGQELARRRLAFDELLLLQVDLQRRRAVRDSSLRAPALVGGRELTAGWIEGLPFSPTGDQRRAIDTIDRDLSSTRPMSRLLMGEVGSGKTVVALHAMLRAVECGAQAMLMAPTETLAAQHHRTVERLLDGMPIPFALLTGSTTTARRREILDRLGSGELPILVGTHALLEDDVEAPSLAICVVDEQHRFGVRQRERLAARSGGLEPHVLHRPATPIPRTLALAAYGDIDTTALREMPPGRRPVETHVVTGTQARERAWARIREEVAGGGRAFIVCPLVEVSEAVDRKAATEEHQRLAEGPFAGLSVGLLHGRMKPSEKEEVMASFASGGIDVLVSTTVIEVGIDVPEATVMMVEDAGSFGLAQLHQLRGRVARGPHQGICGAVTGSGDEPHPRVDAFVATCDGFALAEQDLLLRGPGDLVGTRQSGAPPLYLADLLRDSAVVAEARRDALAVFEQDPELSDPKFDRLRKLVLDRWGAMLGLGQVG